LRALSASLDQGVGALILANTEQVRGQVLSLLRERNGETWTLTVEHPAYLLLIRK
jgi:hypothetical protein